MCFGMVKSKNLNTSLEKVRISHDSSFVVSSIQYTEGYCLWFIHFGKTILTYLFQQKIKLIVKLKWVILRSENDLTKWKWSWLSAKIVEESVSSSQTIKHIGQNTSECAADEGTWNLVKQYTEGYERRLISIELNIFYSLNKIWLSNMCLGVIWLIITHFNYIILWKYWKNSGILLKHRIQRLFSKKYKLT